jgi:hypothetical protein
VGGREKEDDSPTAAFLLLENTIKATINTMLSAHTMIFAMLPKLPSEPAFKIPHSGFTPTGAETASMDKPVKEDVSKLSTI